MKKKTTWILALVLLVLLVGAGTLYRKLAAKQAGSQLQAEARSTTAAESPAAEGQDSIASKAGAESTAEESSEALTAAPDFTVQEADGTVHKLSEYKGKPIVLNFWASWCGPCRAEMPEFNEVYKERGTEVQFLMVNLTDGNLGLCRGAGLQPADSLRYGTGRGENLRCVFDSLHLLYRCERHDDRAGARRHRQRYPAARYRNDYNEIRRTGCAFAHPVFLSGLPQGFPKTKTPQCRLLPALRGFLPTFFVR